PFRRGARLGCHAGHGAKHHAAHRNHARRPSASSSDYDRCLCARGPQPETNCAAVARLRGGGAAARAATVFTCCTGSRDPTPDTIGFTQEPQRAATFDIVPKFRQLEFYWVRKIKNAATPMKPR